MKTNTLPIDAISSFCSGATEKTQMMHENLFYGIGLAVSLIINMLLMQFRWGCSVCASTDQKVHQDVLFMSLLLLNLL